MNYTPRRPYYDDVPDGYQESDRDYVLNNLDLAVALLDAHGKLTTGLIDTVALAQLEAELQITRDQREFLRSKYLQLQNEIAVLLPAHDGDRANDPIINRVRRVSEELLKLVAYDEGLNNREEVYEISDAQHAFDTIRWLMGVKP